MQSYTHFTLDERESLLKKIDEGKSQSQIARELGRDRSSVSREIRRNSNQQGGYNAWGATTKYIVRRKRCTRHKRLEGQTELIGWIKEKLMRGWSPEAIVAIYKHDNLGKKLSFTTIYRAVRRGTFVGCTPKNCLRRRGRRRYERNGKYNAVKPDFNISQRPKEANNRERIGHWEGDTVCGKQSSGRVIVTCVDRKSRFLAAAFSDSKETTKINDAITAALEKLPILSLTLDNGSEFTKHRILSETLKTTIFFADPRSPWQRGTNENINDVLRFYYPKGIDLRGVSEDDLRSVVDLINDRPRKCLGWLSPREFLLAKCCT